MSDPSSPVSFVLAGSLGEWLFVVEGGRATRIVNLRKFAVLVWTRIDDAAGNKLQAAVTAFA